MIRFKPYGINRFTANHDCALKLHFDWIAVEKAFFRTGFLARHAARKEYGRENAGRLTALFGRALKIHVPIPLSLRGRQRGGIE